MYSEELEYKMCANPKCRNEFGVNNHDQKYCCQDCQWENSAMTPQERIKWAHQQSIKLALPGTLARGGQKTVLKGANIVTKLESKPGEKKILHVLKKEEMPIQKNTDKKAENITPKIKSDSTEKKQIKENLIPINIMKNNGDHMQSQESTDLKLLKKADSVEIHSSDSTQSLVPLKEENSSSIQQLNDASKYLLELAKSLSKPKTEDEDGEVIQRAPNHNVEVALKCVSEFRNVMQTKLGYLKLGKDILQEQVK